MSEARAIMPPEVKMLPGMKLRQAQPIAALTLYGGLQKMAHFAMHALGCTITIAPSDCSVRRRSADEKAPSIGRYDCPISALESVVSVAGDGQLWLRADRGER
jgi:hypothetical protein